MGLLEKSTEIKKIFSFLDKIKHRETTILIEGQSGTGKELIARAIHKDSARSAKPFVTINCSALNDNLLESELFGHRQGAFTGAVKDKPGLFETANTGTLFLDEIGRHIFEYASKTFKSFTRRLFYSCRRYQI